MRREQRVRQAPERMIPRQRLAVVDVERRRDAAALERCDQRRLVDQRSARGVDQQRARLHAGELRRADDAARALRQHEMQADDVGLRQQLVLRDIGRAAGGGFLRRQVLAPGDHLHAEHGAVARHALAELAEPHQAQHLAVKLVARRDAVLEAAAPHAGVGLRDVACRRQHQGEGELRRGRAGPTAARPGDGDALRAHRIHVDRAAAYAGHGEEAQLRQAPHQRGREGGALAHRHQDVELLQRLRRLILAGEGVVKERDLRLGAQPRPIGALLRHTLPVVEHRHFHRHAFSLPPLVRRAASGRDRACPARSSPHIADRSAWSSRRRARGSPARSG